MTTKSELELVFDTHIEQAGLPAPVKEWRFCPWRQWRLDRAWPELRIAVEIDGGTWKRTRTGRSAGHAHPKRMREDNEKRNAARLLGWTVYQFTSGAVLEGEALKVIREALHGGA